MRTHSEPRDCENRGSECGTRRSLPRETVDAYDGAMRKSTMWSTVGAVIAVIIALWVVNVVLSVTWFLVKLAIVVVVAVVIYGLIKAAFRSKDRTRG